MDKPYFVIKPYKKDRKIERYMEKVRLDLSKFFGVKAILPRVFFIDSRKLYDRLLQTKTRSWLVGKADGYNIFIFDQKNMAKYSNNNYKDRFWKVLKHEYSHIIFMAACRKTAPVWLNEGLACYLADQPKVKPELKKALEVLNYYFDSGEFVYEVGYFWVKYLIENYGKRKFLKLLRSLRKMNDLADFQKVFYTIYGIRFTKSGLSQAYSKS